MAAAVIERLLEELSAAEEPLEPLRNLRTALSASHRTGLRDSLSPAQLGLIFSLLNTTDRWVLTVSQH